MARNRTECFGYSDDSSRGCRWLDIKPSEILCSKCSFYKTEKEYYEGQRESDSILAFKKLKAVVKFNGSYCVIHAEKKDEYEED